MSDEGCTGKHEWNRSHKPIELPDISLSDRIFSHGASERARENFRNRRMGVNPMPLNLNHVNTPCPYKAGDKVRMKDVDLSNRDYGVGPSGLSRVIPVGAILTVTAERGLCGPHQFRAENPFGDGENWSPIIDVDDVEPAPAFSGSFSFDRPILGADIVTIVENEKGPHKCHCPEINFAFNGVGCTCNGL